MRVNSQAILNYFVWRPSDTMRQQHSSSVQPQDPTLRPLPSGPFSLCSVSHEADLFNITSIELEKSPLYIDDDFHIHIYGSFLHSFAPEAKLTLRVDCGSHCEDYGAPPGTRPGESVSANLCDISNIEQPLGRGPRNVTCPPEPGYALITLPGYIMPMYLGAPGYYNFTVDVTANTTNIGNERAVEAANGAGGKGGRIFCFTTELCLRWEDEDKNRWYPPNPYRDCKWPR